MKRVLSDGAVPVKVWTDDIEETALGQLRNLSKLPFVHRHVAVMPDVHAGYGSTVGSVIPTKAAIIPAAVGVDIGCGMMAQRLPLGASDLPDNLSTARSAIEAAIPHGRTDHGGPNDRGAWGEPTEIAANAWIQSLEARLAAILHKNPKLVTGRAGVNTVRHLGTLGTGNHFVELCLDQDDAVWLMLHSGSRGIGNRIGTYFTELAKDDMRRWFVNLPDADLAYFPEGTEHFDEYIEAMLWAQDYAVLNRQLMMQAAIEALSATLNRPLSGDGLMAVNCHHNYATKEHHFGANVWVTRKGAVRARQGDLGIIPGSMGARSYIVEGLGNPESFHSCSHGAGRRMSRGKARASFTTTDLKTQTAGVECRKDADVLDEIPGAYKNIDVVMANQADLVRPLFTLRQVVCVKG